DLHRLAIGRPVGERAEGVADLPDEDDAVLEDDVGEEPVGDRRAPGLCRHLIDDGGLLLLGKDRTQQQGPELAGGGEGFGQQTERRYGRTDPGRILQVEESLRVSLCNRRLDHLSVTAFAGAQRYAKALFDLQDPSGIGPSD